jgi:hypothetical protein
VNVLASIRNAVSIQAVLLVTVSLALIGCALYILVRSLRKPKDKEKRRRLEVNQYGRLGDATVVEVNESAIFYEYSVRGVGYTASQDISQLSEHIPSDPARLIGPATLKYSPANPANSIILCEEWSGLRPASPTKSAKDAARLNLH